MCGGTGTRLWPLSRKSYPKQFARLLSARSLFQEAASRVQGDGFAAPLVVSAVDYRFIVTEQLVDTGIDPGAVLLEPEPRNTAPAVLAAATWLARTAGPEALMLITPSDHAVTDPDAFRARIRAGIPAARAGALVLFGITPTHAETGYGYLEPEGLAEAQGGAVPLRSFVEKPDADQARALLEGDRHLWNSGLFLFTAQTILEAFAAHAPDLCAPVTAAVDGVRHDLGFARLDPDPWQTVAGISLDYAVMERARNLSVLRLETPWSDLGNWDSVAQHSPRDGNGNALGGDAMALDCTGTLLRSETGGRQTLVGLGLKDIIAVAMPDGVLVTHRDRAQDVGQAVAALRRSGHPQADQFPRDHRPWGSFESLVVGPRFQVKRIEVKPGAALSLQSHMHRAEHWIVVSGTARVTIDDAVSLVPENGSIFVPIGARHRLENPGKVPLTLIEVQTGSYLGEDDITRYDDVYARR
ncbi:mannose-1-phosphate guanylyltransferase/mannose-6-phosphate isomerase (plasmid) [Tateyamaria omphalii]|uniref:mannose-1-phosphate guanylyltransferase n=2 Tax=Tateyamaria omphalii TaxID=299262 RepID=A0A1P8N213_9RHOB|nr:mannose-1-phosphate guanylyltransferase/mannose-6-phosphate isomerase [Tateyamaria omphalii]